MISISSTFCWLQCASQLLVPTKQMIWSRANLKSFSKSILNRLNVHLSEGDIPRHEALYSARQFIMLQRWSIFLAVKIFSLTDWFILFDHRIASGMFCCFLGSSLQLPTIIIFGLIEQLAAWMITYWFEPGIDASFRFTLKKEARCQLPHHTKLVSSSCLYVFRCWDKPFVNSHISFSYYILYRLLFTWLMLNLSISILTLLNFFAFALTLWVFSQQLNQVLNP